MKAAVLYTLAERARMRLALPDLVEREQQLREAAAAEGITYIIPEYGGTRTEADQKQLVKWRDEAVAKDGQKAYYQVAAYGHSKHEVGAAFDTSLKSWPEGTTKTAAELRLGQLAEGLGLTWGGRWDGKTQDIPHKELKATRAQLEPMYLAYVAGDPVAKALGQVATVVGGEGLATAVKGGGIAAGMAMALAAYVVLFGGRKS